jgi:predicted transcriptional regulator
MTETADRILAATTHIVTAWLDSNAIAPIALPGLIRDVHRSLTGTEPDRSGGKPKDVRPAVDIRRLCSPIASCAWKTARRSRR